MTATDRPNLDLATVQRIRKLAVLLALVGLVGLASVTQSIGGVDGDWHEHVESVGLVAMVFSIVGRAWCSLYIGGRKKAEIVDRGEAVLDRVAHGRPCALPADVRNDLPEELAVLAALVLERRGSGD